MDFNNKIKKLSDLKEKINSIENCNLKDNSKNLILGDGDVNGSIMLIGEAPGSAEDNSGSSFQGDVGTLLNKMLYQKVGVQHLTNICCMAMLVTTFLVTAMLVGFFEIQLLNLQML